MPELEKGFIQIYTGNGKGKTTAAIGQAVRAAGSGLRSYIIQFMKEYPYSELQGISYLNEWITLEQYCGDEFVLQKQAPPAEEILKAQKGLETAKNKMLSGKYDIIILDEVCVAIYFGLLETESIIQFMKEKPGNVELILTGRYCTAELIDAADLVTDMGEVKHYYRYGIKARKGIES